jgi:hypothetical protein
MGEDLPKRSVGKWYRRSEDVIRSGTIIAPGEEPMTLFVQRFCLRTVRLAICKVVGFFDRIVNFLLLRYGLCGDDLC